MHTACQRLKTDFNLRFLSVFDRLKVVASAGFVKCSKVMLADLQTEVAMRAFGRSGFGLLLACRFGTTCKTGIVRFTIPGRFHAVLGIR